MIMQTQSTAEQGHTQSLSSRLRNRFKLQIGLNLVSCVKWLRSENISMVFSWKTKPLVSLSNLEQHPLQASWPV